MPVKKRKITVKKAKSLYEQIKDNARIIGAFSFIFAIVGFCVGVYSDVMKVDDLQSEIVRLNTKIDKLVELIIENSANKFEEKGKAPKLGEIKWKKMN